MIRAALAGLLLVAIPSTLPAQVYWTLSGSASDQVQRADLNGANYTSLVDPTPGTSPWAIAASPANDRIYWSDIISPFSIYRSTASGGSPTAIANSGSTSIMSLAYDSGRGPLVFRDDRRAGQIVRINGDGTSPTPLATGLQGVNGMAIDRSAGKIYWVEQTANRIARMNFDGSNIETIVNTTYAGTTTERGVALDGHGGLYWTDSNTDGVYKIDLGNYTGTPITATAANQIVNLATLTGGNASPNGIASDGVSLYWTEAISGAARGIYRSALDGTSAGLLVSTSPTANAPIGISAVPEPSTLLLAAVGLAAMWRRRRRVELVFIQDRGCGPNSIRFQFEIEIGRIDFLRFVGF